VLRDSKTERRRVADQLRLSNNAPASCALPGRAKHVFFGRPAANNLTQ
jgi:hypothetical protein